MQTVKLTPPPFHQTIYTATLDEANKDGRMQRTVGFTTIVRSIPLYSQNIKRDFEWYIAALKAAGWKELAL